MSNKKNKLKRLTYVLIRRTSDEIWVLNPIIFKPSVLPMNLYREIYYKKTIIFFFEIELIVTKSTY